MVYKNGLREVNFGIAIACLGITVLFLKGQDPAACKLLHCLLMGVGMYVVLNTTKWAKYLVPLGYCLLIFV